MAVLVECISVIVRRDSIDERMQKGWEGFLELVSNMTMCTDGEVVRVGFMGPGDVEEFVGMLESEGLVFIRDGRQGAPSQMNFGGMERSPEKCTGMESKHRLSTILCLMPFVFPKVESVRHDRGEGDEWGY